MGDTIDGRARATIVPMGPTTERGNAMTEHATRPGAHAARSHDAPTTLRAPYVCRDDDGADGCAHVEAWTPAVHTPAAPFLLPPSGARIDVRTGAHVIWRTTDDGAHVNVLLVPSDPTPFTRPYGRAREVPRVPAFTPLACAACRAALASIVGRRIRTTAATCHHMRPNARSLRAWTFDPYDGTRPSNAFLQRWRRTSERDARVTFGEAFKRARADAMTSDAPPTHTCPAERHPRVPRALPHGGTWTPATCRAPHATPADAAACRRHLDDVNAPMQARRDAARAAVLARRAALTSAWFGVLLASTCRGNVAPPTFGTRAA